MNAEGAKKHAWLVPALMAGALAAAPFDPLFRVMNPNGLCEVRKPGSSVTEPASKGRAYPYGTAVLTGRDSSAIVVLSKNDAIQLGADTAVTVSSDLDRPENKILRLDRGHIVSSTNPDNEAEALIVETPVGRAQALSGRCSFVLQATTDDFTLDVHAESGTLSIDGPQFRVPELKNGYKMRITTTRDHSMTRLYNTLGDYTLLIDNGTPDPLQIDTSTQSSVRIWREHAPVGGRLIVSILATGADGKGRECFAFAVGQPDVASGMLLQDETATNGTDMAFETKTQEAFPEMDMPESQSDRDAFDPNELFQ